MKLPAVIIASIVIWVAIRGAAAGQVREPDAEKNPLVSVDVRLSASALKRGDSGELHILFSPADGIHINSPPPLGVSLDPPRLLRLNGAPLQATDRGNAYLLATLPVRQLFTVSRKARPGTLTLRGTITYYYCSDPEGWCRKSTHPFALSLTIVK